MATSLVDFIEEMVAGEILRLVISMPVDKKATVRRITVRRLSSGFQEERQIGAQVFQKNLTEAELKTLVQSSLEQDYRQLNAWTKQHELCLTVAVDGSLKTKRKTLSEPVEEQPHNRVKKHLLAENTVIPPLVDMGIFTPTGRLVGAMADKYRQINRFLEFIDEAIGDDYHGKPFHAIDFGCGKSYLTFVMYYYLTQLKGIDARMVGLDLKAEVIRHCSEAARKYGYGKLSFEVGDIHGYQTTEPVDMVVTLHACNTATDFALAHAVNWGARHILSVPCCQHELNDQMQSSHLTALTRYGIVQERVAALMTDAIRANLLTVCGYRTQILEFVDLSHTPKNLLIRAVKSAIPEEIKKRAWSETQALIEEFSFKPTLIELLGERLAEFQD